jgi:phenylacetate-CoA ligase
MSLALRIYHRLPAGSRSVVASLRGYYLSRWRYDKFTERLVEEALERDAWSEKQWSEWRAERLSYILDRAATRVPYYRQLWEERRRNGDKASPQYLENWPLLEKTTLRTRSREFVADDRSVSRMFHEHTSGTTGGQLDLWFDRDAVKQWYALFEARCRRWNGVSRHDRWAILGGQLVTPVSQQRPPFWIWNAGMNQLYLSSYHLSPPLIRHYLQAIVRYRIKYILGYPSAIYSLALEALKLRRNDLKMDVILTNAEPLYQHQREAIAEAFSCPVRETYGMAEVVAAASECDHGSLHQWPDVGIIERARNPASADSGDLICTGLINADMPLIRYRVGDYGKLSLDRCACGRNLPLLESIDGRSDDVLLTSDGREVGRLDPIFKNKLPIIEAQIIQESLKTIRIRYVPSADFTSDTLRTLTESVRERLGDVEVIYDKESEIPRTSRGKFRAVICNLTPAEKAQRSNATT